MANKRMFSLSVVDTDAFLEMPTSSQLLYFHLSMRADDEGFVSSPKKIMKMVGSGEDDYKVLIVRKFIIPFESGVCVIKHWLIHNTVRLDRFAGTNYIKEKSQLLIKDNKAYKLINVEEQGLIDGKPNGNQMATQVKLSEVKLSKDKRVYGEFKNVFLLEEEYEKLIDGLGEPNTQLLVEELSGYMASKKKKYDSHYATIKNWARRRIIENKNNKKGKGIIL